MDDELRLAASIEGLSLRFYTASETEPEYPWTSFVDLLALLEMPKRDRILAGMPPSSPHSFRRGSDGTTAICHFAALELAEEFATPSRAAAWHEIGREVFIDHCRAPTETEWEAKLAEAAQRSLDIAKEGFARLQATSSRH